YAWWCPHELGRTTYVAQSGSWRYLLLTGTTLPDTGCDLNPGSNPNHAALRRPQGLDPGPHRQDRPWRLARRVRPPRGPDRRGLHRGHHVPRWRCERQVLER